MSRPLPAAYFLALIAAAALAACSPKQGGKPGIQLPSLSGSGPAFDKAKLEAAIDPSFGGPGTCLVIDDTASGREVYRYNSHMACGRQLPPCSTFKIANSLIGLDAGLVTPQTVFKWDGTPQPVKGWEHDADMKTAFKQSIVWWYQRLAQKVGAPAYRERLRAFDYGNRSPTGPLTTFWLGPAAGGGLVISTQEQAAFLHRLYAGRLPVKPASLAFVESIMVDEIRGGWTMSGKTGSCPSLGDNTRQVAWWVGRLKGPNADYVFAVSVEGENASALPGLEVETRVKSAFAQAGLWPPL